MRQSCDDHVRDATFRGGQDTYVDESIDTAVLDHFPSVLGGRDVGLAVEGNVRESVAVEQGDGPVKEADETAKDAEEDVADHVAVGSSLRTCNGAHVAQEVDDGDDQTAKADGTKAVRQSALQCAAGGTAREVVDAEVPGTVDARNSNVDDVLENLGDPVHGKGDEDDESGDGAGATIRVAAVGIGI